MEEWESLDREIKDDEEIMEDERLDVIEATLNRLMLIVEDIREKVSTEKYERKIKTTNTMIKTLNDLDEKVTDNMNRLNEMLKRLKGIVAVALGNLAQ